MKYEYTFFSFNRDEGLAHADGHTGIMVDRLNDLGKEGWSVINIDLAQGFYTVLLQRQV